jgi:hypothetical protein
MNGIPITCPRCGQPLQPGVDKFADEAGNVVHQTCFEGQILEARNGQGEGAQPAVAAPAVQGWIAVYHLALLELDRARMPARLNEARHEMFDRVEELRDLSGSHDGEHQAIQDALAKIRSLEMEQQQWAAEQEQRAG